ILRDVMEERPHGDVILGKRIDQAHATIDFVEDKSDAGDELAVILREQRARSGIARNAEVAEALVVKTGNFDRWVDALRLHPPKFEIVEARISNLAFGLQR